MAKRMTIGVVVLVLIVAGVGLTRATGEPKSSFGFTGLTEVRELVVVYAPGAAVTVKAHLVTGVMIEDEVSGDAADRVLQISAAFAQPRARLAVNLEKGGIESFHLATGAGSRER